MAVLVDKKNNLRIRLNVKPLEFFIDFPELLFIHYKIGTAHGTYKISQLMSLNQPHFASFCNFSHPASTSVWLFSGSHSLPGAKTCLNLPWGFMKSLIGSFSLGVEAVSYR